MSWDGNVSIDEERGSSAESSPSCDIGFTLTDDSVITGLEGFATLSGIDQNLNAVNVNGPGSITDSGVE